MTKKERPVMIWVAPQFKIKLKTEAAQEDTSIIDYTKKLASMKSVEEQLEDATKPLADDKPKKRRFSLDW